MQAEQQPAETDWGRQLVQAEHNSLLLQQQLCGSHTWTYLSEHLQLDLAEAIEIALVPATTPEECEAQGTLLAQRIKTAIRWVLAPQQCSCIIHNALAAKQFPFRQNCRIIQQWHKEHPACCAAQT